MKLTIRTIAFFLCLLINCSLSPKAFGQTETETKIQVGPYLGNGFRMLTGNDVSDIGFGYHIGLISRFPLNKIVSLTPTVAYARKGYNHFGIILFEEEEFYKQRLSYLDFYLPLKFQAGNVFTFMVGMQAGILLNGELAYQTYGDQKHTVNIKNDLHDVDWGMVFGAGCQFMNGIGLELMVNPGFSNIYEETPPLYYDNDANAFFGDEFNGKNLLTTINIFYLFGYAKPQAK